MLQDRWGFRLWPAPTHTQESVQWGQQSCARSQTLQDGPQLWDFPPLPQATAWPSPLVDSHTMIVSPKESNPVPLQWSGNPNRLAGLCCLSQIVISSCQVQNRIFRPFTFPICSVPTSEADSCNLSNLTLLKHKYVFLSRFNLGAENRIVGDGLNKHFLRPLDY